MKKPLLALLLLAPCAAVAPAQTPTGARSDAILLNVRKLDVLIQVVPLALKKEQFSPLLAAIEKVHGEEKKLQAQEDKDLLTIEAKTTKIVEDGEKSGTYPPREQQVEIAKFMSAMGLRRTMAAYDFVQTVYDACVKTLDAGQMKIMEKSLKPDLLDPSLKPDTMTSEQKVKFFIRKVILDPIAYDVLVEMSKNVKDQPAAPAPPTSPSI